MARLAQPRSAGSDPPRPTGAGRTRGQHRRALGVIIPCALAGVACSFPDMTFRNEPTSSSSSGGDGHGGAGASSASSSPDGNGGSATSTGGSGQCVPGDCSVSRDKDHDNHDDAKCSPKGDDCDDCDDRAYPGATDFQITERKGVNGWDFDCDTFDEPQYKSVNCPPIATTECAATEKVFKMSSAVPCGTIAPLTDCPLIVCKTQSVNATQGCR